MAALTHDVAIIGGGIVGMSTARALLERARLSLVVLEAEDRLAAHQSGRNSGVIHSGLYYKPGSKKAQNCVEGSKAMLRFCLEYGIPHERCGKLVVATSPSEIPALEELERRGQANGLVGVRRLDGHQIRELEPHVAGIAGLHVPETGIADYPRVTQVYAELARAKGATVRTGSRVLKVEPCDGGFLLTTSSGEVRAGNLINCAGLQSDRIARLCGLDPKLRIIPFRGEYYELVPERRSLVKNLIYPVPDPQFPFLGVHYTRMTNGAVEAGPNAVLAFKREGYSLLSASPRDLLDMISYGGFWRLIGKYWKTGMGEMVRSLSKGAFVRALQKLIPELTAADLHPARAGVRAQAVDASGKLLDDFHFLETEHMIHVLNAPSPAATASITIGDTIAEMATKNFNLHTLSS